MFEAAVIVKGNDDEVSSTYPDGIVQMISWNAIETVEVHTNDSGLWVANVWWIL
ncbi:hypothetical protein [Shewanella woodyi]|uniref:hypothetical protein n=1 Tax=Shewanella woodyi TaxID=60961 RepID=UPI0012F7ADD9|nr:hypothetical protein [Shewanella woodyi]